MPVSQLHYECRLREYLYARAQLQRFPDEAASLNTVRQLPLHVVVHHLFHWDRYTYRRWPDDLVDLIYDLLDTYPASVGVRDRRGDTPLLIACKAIERRYVDFREQSLSEETEIQLDVFSNMLDACPEAARIQSESGAFPLQLILQYGSTPIWLVQKLMRLYPRAIVRYNDRLLKYPLVEYCRFEQTLRHIRPIVEIYPRASLVNYDRGYDIGTNRSHSTLAEFVWDALFEEIRRERRVPPAQRFDPLTGAELVALVTNRGQWGTYIDAILFLLKAAYHGTTGDLPAGRVFRALHAACSFDLGHDFIRFIAKLEPQQLMQADEENGWLPLHIASRNRNNYEIRPKVLKLLLGHCPAAAMTLDSNQQLPLHLALEGSARCQDGVMSLVAAAPRSLLVRDGRTGLYPALLAAATWPHGQMREATIIRMPDGQVTLVRNGLRPRPNLPSGTRDDWLTTIYSLLRADPTIVHRATSASR